LSGKFLCLSRLLALAAVILISGCSTKHEVKVAPVEVKPIHITIDVNIKVDRALNNFFGDLDAEEAKAGSKPTAAPQAK
jgi:uncharacterized lipoprotein YehR (DUF1307 family)